MPTYELIFYTDAVPEGQVDDLIDDFDAVITTDHFGRHSVSLAMSGTDCRDSAMTAISELARRDVVVRRMQEDLVTRSDIADRLQVSRQAVGLWARGERQKGFPAPVHAVAGGVWLWGDVVRWAQRVLNYDACGMEFPGLSDHDRVNAMCAGRAATVVQESPTQHMVTVGWSRHDAEALPATGSKPAHLRLSYALAV